MGIGWRSALGAALWLACASAEAQSPSPPPVEAFGRLPAVMDAAISPDGTMVALGQTRDNTSFINVVNIAEKRSVYTAAVPEDTQLRGVGWAEEGRPSFVVSQALRPGMVLPYYVRFRGNPGRVEYWRTGVLDLATRRLRILTTNDEEGWQDMGAYLIAPIEGDPGYGRMIGRAPGVESSRPAVYRVNLTGSGTGRYLATRGANEDTVSYLLDERGAVVARTDSDDETNRWRIFVYDNETPRLLLEDVSDTGQPLGLVGIFADGRIAAIDENAAGEFYELYAIDRATGARELMFKREGYEVLGTIDDPWTRRATGVSWFENDYQQQFFEPALQSAYEHVREAFAAGSAHLSSWSRDRSRILVYGENGLDGGGYYILIPGENNRIMRVSMRYPDLGETAGQRQSITYRARDGVRIPAYLTLPAVDPARNLPLVVLPHGGPHSRDTMDFDWWASFLASRGYVVLQPNFRGSTGYGKSWEHAGRGQWGARMQTDVEDGARALVRNGIADANRMCIVGASYGGYAALAGVTLTPDLYKCAVSVAGVSDLVEMLRQSEVESGRESMASDHWRLSIGDWRQDRTRIREVSPAYLADRVTAPVLLIHGTDDTVVPILQSRRMLDRLRDNNKNVRFVELRGDDHWLSDAETRIQMLREIETFLAAHIGPQRTAGAPAQ